MSKKNIQDIVKDRKIIKMKNQRVGSVDYEVWEVQLPIYADVVERLLENGFLVSMTKPNRITVVREVPPSPHQIKNNKKFWRELTKELMGDEEK
jgi:hypothetical protein